MRFVALTAMLALSLVAPAAADGQGAQTVVTTECENLGSLIRCYETRTLTNTTATPSGNVSTVEHVRTEEHIIGASDGCLLDRTIRSSSHTLTGPDASGESSYLERQDFVESCEGGAIVFNCERAVHAHDTGGAEQFDRFDQVCTTQT